MNIIEDKYIFDPYKQEFVLKTSPSGQNILYLEKICLTCKEAQIYDQIKNQCVSKKRLNELEQKQVELCKEYIKIKKQVLPLDKNQLLGILNIKFNGKNILDYLSQPLTRYKSEPLNVIYDLIKFIYQDWFRLSSTGALIYILQEIYKLIGTGANYNVFYFISIFMSFFSKFYNIISKSPGFITRLGTVMSKTFKLIYEYKYLPLYYSKTAIYFILGAIEYLYRESIPINLQRILNNSIINTIILFFSKGKTVNVEVISVSVKDAKTQDIFKSIPNYRYYSRANILYGLFEENDYLFFKPQLDPKFKVEYLKQNIEKQNGNKKNYILNSFSHFYKQLTLSDVELLKKNGIVSNDNKYLFLDNIGLEHLKEPEKQIKQLILYKTNTDSNISETGLLYINNAGEEEIKSIYASAQRNPIDTILLNRFEKEIAPMYKIFNKEINILEKLLIKSENNYKRKNEELNASIKELMSSIKQYKQKKTMLIKTNKELNELKDKVRMDSKRTSGKKNELIQRYSLEQLNNNKEIKDLSKKIKKQFKLIKKYNTFYLKEFYVNVDTKKNKKIAEKLKQLDKKKTLDKIEDVASIIKENNLKHSVTFIPEEEINKYKLVITILSDLNKEIEKYIDKYSTLMRNSSQNYDAYKKLKDKVYQIINKIELNQNSFNNKYALLLQEKIGTTTSMQTNVKALDDKNTLKILNQIAIAENESVKITKPLQLIESKMNVNPDNELSAKEQQLLLAFGDVILQKK